ncbi:hypothetical protein F5I97DRAFT_2072692 [Phlebopus sp. FC_14]|nr:hypothetical protein F5I97DRAFT_2072692 [Phlebopus sp. FC_14]
MAFGIFTRKSTESSPEARPHEHERARSPLRFPTALRAMLGTSSTNLTSSADSADLQPIGDHEESMIAASPAALPPETPSPPPPDSKALYERIQGIPAKTLHGYTLAHLKPRPAPFISISRPSVDNARADSVTPPPSPDTITKLSKFFAHLSPPPLLHCVRCHADFFEVENEEKDKACHVPHDDESALVERVAGGGHETLWGCCGQTVDGDGGEGPPDGWCYEGRHTTDVKRARFRADSTIHNDKLTSCLKLNCHGVRNQLPRPANPRTSPSRNSRSSPVRKPNPSPSRSHVSASASVVSDSRPRKRPRMSLKEASASEDDRQEDEEAVRGRTTKSKGKRKENADDSSMLVDDVPLPKSKAKSKPVSRAARPPPSTTSTTASLTALSSHANVLSSAKPKSVKAKTSSRTLLSQSHTHLPSDSDASSRAATRPRTRSLVREESRARDASRVRPPTSTRDIQRRVPGTAKLATRDQSRARHAKKPARAETLSRTPSSEGEPEAEETDREGDLAGERGRRRKKRRVGT